MISSKKGHVLGSGIYTLAKHGTAKDTNYKNFPVSLVVGKGVDANDKALLQKWAKRKTITQFVALALIDVCKIKGATERIQGYWNTYHCMSNLTVANGKVYGRYCKNRCCTICLAIRKAKMINRYLPVIKTWEDPHFLTLTVKAQKNYRLSLILDGMHKAFRQIKDKHKKREQRGKGTKLMGIRSLECNFNPSTATYNPHFHIIVPDKRTAHILRREWLNKWTGKFTHPVAQKYSRINGCESALIEVVKYGSKIFTEPDVKNKKNSKIPPKIYADALDNILAEFKGRRLLQPFGFKLPKEKTHKSKHTAIYDFTEMIFNNYTSDWVDLSDGTMLTGYKPSAMLNYLLNDGIDLEKS